jgi:hypothetical protein
MHAFRCGPSERADAPSSAVDTYHTMHARAPLSVPVHEVHVVRLRVIGSLSTCINDYTVNKQASGASI